MKILAMQGFDHLMGTVGTGLARSMSALVASGWNIPNLQAPSNLGYTTVTFQGRTWLQHNDTSSGSNTANYSTQYLAGGSFASLFKTRSTDVTGVIAFRLWLNAASISMLTAWQPMISYGGQNTTMNWFKALTEGVYVIELEIDQVKRKVNIYVDGALVESFDFSQATTVDTSITVKLERYKNGSSAGIRCAFTDFVMTSNEDDTTKSARLGSVEVVDVEINKPSIPKTWSAVDEWDTVFDMGDGVSWAASPILPAQIIDPVIDGIWDISYTGAGAGYDNRAGTVHFRYSAISGSVVTYTCHFTDARKVTGFSLMSYGSNPTYDKAVVEVSDDGEVWRTIDTRDGISARLLQTNSVAVPFKFRTADAGAYKHIRITLSKAASLPASTLVYIYAITFLGDVSDKGTNLHPYILMQNALGSVSTASWDGKTPAWMSSVDGSELSLSHNVKSQFDNATILAVCPSVLAAKQPGGTDKLAVNYAVGNKTTAQLEYVLTNAPAAVVTTDILTKAPSGNSWTVDDIVNAKLVIKSIKGD